MLAATSGASFLGNMLAGRGNKSKRQEDEVAIPGIGVIRAGEETTKV